MDDRIQLFNAAFEEAKELLTKKGSELQKGVLARIIAADIQHHGSLTSWVKEVVEGDPETTDEKEAREDRSFGVAQLLAAQNDIALIGQLLCTVSEMDWNCGGETADLMPFFDKIRGEFDAGVQDELNGEKTVKTQALIDKLNKLVD